MRRVQAVGMSGSCPVQHNDSSAAGRLRPNAVIGKVGFLPVSVPNENEHNETNDRTPCNSHSLHDHSNRNAEIGSIRVAFLAGTQTATSATAHKKIGVRTNAVGSHVFTPNRNPVRNFVSQKAPPIPMTSPIPASSIP